jgi:hypothetical protein
LFAAQSSQDPDSMDTGAGTSSGQDLNAFLVDELQDVGMEVESLFENSDASEQGIEHQNHNNAPPPEQLSSLPEERDGISFGDHPTASSDDDDDVMIIHSSKSSSPIKRFKKTHGRPRSDIWKDFVVTLENGRRTTRCKWCNKIVSAKADRLKLHTGKCHAGHQRKSPGNLNAVSAPGPVSEPVFKGQERGKQAIKGFVDIMSPGEKETIDQKCADFIFSKNIPFDTVQNEKFQEFCKILRPSYKLPDRFQIGGKLLDNAYNKKLSEVRQSIMGKKVTIMQDGWSTVQNDPVIVHAISDGKRTVFVNAIATEDNVKNATYCLELLNAAIKYAQDTFGVEVIGCVTDNCSTMNLLRNELHKQNSELFVYGCNTHLLNLIGRDMSKIDLTETIKSVQRYFRNHHFESSSLKLLKGLRPVLPGDTRWNSQIAMFENYEKNHATYLQVSRKPDSGIDRNSDIFRILNDGNVFTEVSRMIRKLAPIKASLNKVSSVQFVNLICNNNLDFLHHFIFHDHFSVLATKRGRNICGCSKRMD